jgi:cell wall-associated NlpC family hydrolase
MRACQRFILITTFLIFINSCKKQDPIYSYDQEANSEEGLTAEEDSILASLQTKIFKPSEIIFDDGETLEAFIKRTNPGALGTWGMRRIASNNFERTELNTNGDISKTFDIQNIQTDAYKRFYQLLSSTGNSIVSNNVKHDAEPDETVTEKKGSQTLTITYKRPLHFGYGYAYNAEKDLSKRKKAGDCPIKIFGIDCNGLVYWMLFSAGMNIGIMTAADYASEETLNTALATSPSLKAMNMEYVDKGMKWPLDKVVNGDILYFVRKGSTRAFHIGIAVGTNPLYIYQSNGQNALTKYKRKKNGTIEVDANGQPKIESTGCDYYTKADKRGPQCEPVADFVTGRGGFFSNYGVLHLQKKEEDPLLFGTWIITNFTATNSKTHYTQTFGNGKDQFLKIIGDSFEFIDNNEPDDDCAGKYITFGENKKVFKIIGNSCDINGLNKVTIVKLTINELELQGSQVKSGVTVMYNLTAKR